MKQNDDSSTDAWLESLDEIVRGDSVPPADDDELLDLATRLNRTLQPLRGDGTAEISLQRIRDRVLARQKTPARKHPYRLSPLLVAIVLLLMVAGGTIGAGRWTGLWGSVTQSWQTSTSLDQLKGVSIASLARPHAGVKPLPLLPTALPNDTQTSSYGVITDASDPNRLTTFVADYRIAGQDVLLYEQPSDLPFSSSSTNIMHIGAVEGQVFQDKTGTTALQWYQNGMMCQITSKLPIQRLVALASIFQPISSWDILH